MSRLLLQAFNASGLAALARRLLTARGRCVVELHGVPRLDREQVASLPRSLRPCTTFDDLRTICLWLRERFRLLRPAEFLAEDAPGILVTFDDGFANQAAAVSLLAQLEIPAVLFVATGPIARPGSGLHFVADRLADPEAADVRPVVLDEIFAAMSPEQLAACGADEWVTLGSHTVSHPFLTRLDDEALRRELRASKDFLEASTGRTVDLLAYPAGDYDRRVALAARDAGYAAAFAEDTRGAGVDGYEIPRIGLYASDRAYLAAKLSGLHRRPLPVRRSGLVT